MRRNCLFFVRHIQISRSFGSFPLSHHLKRVCVCVPSPAETRDCVKNNVKRPSFACNSSDVLSRRPCYMEMEWNVWVCVSPARFSLFCSNRQFFKQFHRRKRREELFEERSCLGLLLCASFLLFMRWARVSRNINKERNLLNKTLWGREIMGIHINVVILYILSRTLISGDACYGFYYWAKMEQEKKSSYFKYIQEKWIQDISSMG